VASHSCQRDFRRGCEDVHTPAPLYVIEVVLVLDIESRPNATILHVSGDLDIASSEQLSSAIESASTTSDLPIVVSLENCPYCDSTGLSIFVKTSKRLGNKFAIVVPPGSRCARVFDVTGLKKALPVYPSLDRVPQLLGHEDNGDESGSMSRGDALA
jgi:anti-sigma B factor antagonist